MVGVRLKKLGKEIVEVFECDAKESNFILYPVGEIIEKGWAEHG